MDFIYIPQQPRDASDQGVSIGGYLYYIFATKSPLTGAGLHMNIVKNELVLGSRPDYLKLYCYCQTNMQFPEKKTKHQARCESFHCINVGFRILAHF